MIPGKEDILIATDPSFALAVYNYYLFFSMDSTIPISKLFLLVTQIGVPTQRIPS